MKRELNASLVVKTYIELYLHFTTTVYTSDSFRTAIKTIVDRPSVYTWNDFPVITDFGAVSNVKHNDMRYVVNRTGFCATEIENTPS